MVWLFNLNKKLALGLDWDRFMVKVEVEFRLESCEMGYKFH